MAVAILDAMTHTTSGAPSGWTPSAGSDRVAFIAMLGYHFSNAVPPTSATFGGQSMELIASVDATATALAIFALRESGIAAMSGNTFTPTGATLSAWNSVYWSVSGAAQSSGIVSNTANSAAAINLSLARVADSYSAAVAAYPLDDALTFTNPTQTASAWMGTAYRMIYGGATDSLRTVDFTSTNTGSTETVIVFNMAPAAAGGSGNIKSHLMLSGMGG